MTADIYAAAHKLVAERQAAMTRREYAAYKAQLFVTLQLALRGSVSGDEIEQAYADAWAEWPNLPGRVDEQNGDSQC